jgi:ATP-binding cassette subfamily C protein
MSEPNASPDLPTPPDHLATSARVKLASLFSPQDRKRLVWLLLAIILMAFLQVIGIASILPFLDLAANPEAISDDTRLGVFYQAIGLNEPRSALITTGVCVIALLAISNAASAYLVWHRQRLSWSVAHHLSLRLVNRYIALPYTFFLTNSSSDLIKKNINDVNGIVNGILLAGSTLITNLLVSVLLLVLLLAVQPIATLIAASALVLLFGVIALTRRRYLSALGRQNMEVNLRRFATFVDLVGGIKTVKTDGAHPFFVDRFARASEEFSHINPKVQFAAAAPRFAVEVLAFGGVVVATIVLVSGGAALADALPTLTLFAVAGYRLIPAISNAYASYAVMVASFPAVDSIYEDLQHPQSDAFDQHAPTPFTDRIDVKDVSFRYDAVNPQVLNAVSLTLKRGEKTAFVGPSGSGKSTLIDIIVGLFSPMSGSVLIDGAPLNDTNKAGWRARVGYVPQVVYLYDDSIAHNIAFGQTEIDQDRLREACAWAQLGPLLEKLPEGLDTQLGERGVRLSGGERQRIGLARAFYRRPEVLVLDEATSALDSKTEKAVIEAIEHNLPDATVLMIAHRISTVRNCDRLYVMDRGDIVAQGSFADLVKSNELFQELAQIS